MRLREAGLKDYRSTDQVQSDVMPSSLMGDHAKVMQRPGMIWLLGEDLAVKLPGLVQPPASVLLQCQLKGLLDRDLSHWGD